MALNAAMIKRTLAALTLLCSAAVPALAGESEQSAALYNSAKLWAPLNYNNDQIWYVDPNSVYKVSEHEWDLNLTALNNSNQYVISETKTFRINCQNYDILPNIGWRVNGILKENRGPLGIRSTKDSRFKSSPGQVIWTAKEYVCGVSNYGSNYYFHYAWFRNGQLRGVIDQVWIKGNVVHVSQNDPNIRRIDTMISVLGGTTPAFRELYYKCDKREWMEAENGVTTTNWTVASSGVYFDFVFSKLCSGNSNVVSYQTTSFTIPAPLPAATGSEQSASSSDIQGAKQKCLALGFKAGTPKFGQCVLKLSQ
jgi:hypothetical protein